MSNQLHVSVSSSSGRHKLWVSLSKMREHGMEPIVYNYSVQLNDGRLLPAGPYCAIDFRPACPQASDRWYRRSAKTA